MADEIQLQFEVPGPPRSVMDIWRAVPPPPLGDDGYELADESYNSLTWEARYLDWPGKLVVYLTFGVGWFFRGFMESLFRLTARFDEQGTNTRVLLVGTAHPRTREGLEALAAQHGGPTSPPGSPASWPGTPLP